VKPVNIFAVMMSQLEDELESFQEEACLRDHQLEATRELVTVLQKHIDVCQHQLDTQSVVFIIIVVPVGVKFSSQKYMEHFSCTRWVLGQMAQS